MLISETLGEPVVEARIRYHADNVTAKFPIDDQARQDLRDSVQRARELRQFEQRPPVTENERLCSTCSLAPVCLPEEERGKDEQLQLFPARRKGQTLHVVSPKARVGRSSNTIVLTVEDEKQKCPIEDLDSVVVHGSGQVRTQALHLLSSRGVPVQWYSAGGKFMAGTQSVSGRVRQRIRQFTALTNDDTCLRLARATVTANIEIGAIHFDKDGAVASEFQTYVRPKREIPQFIMTLTGIGCEAVRDAPGVDHALIAFTEWLPVDCPLVAHNAAFDFEVFRCSGATVVGRTCCWFDSRVFARRLRMFRNEKLATIATALGIRGDLHRAVADAHVVAALTQLALRTLSDSDILAAVLDRNGVARTQRLRR